MKLEVFTHPETRLKWCDVVCHWDYEFPAMLLNHYDLTGEGVTCNIDDFRSKKIGGLVVGPSPNENLQGVHNIIGLPNGSLVIWRDVDRNTTLRRKPLFNLELPLP